MPLEMKTRNFEKRTAKLLQRFGQAGLRVVGREAANLVKDSIEQSFNSASDPITGAKWKRRKKRYAHRPLQKTGALRSGVRTTYALRGYSVGIYADICGKASDYGWHHQTGTVRLPRRRFLGFSPRNRKRLSSFINKMVTK